LETRTLLDGDTLQITTLLSATDSMAVAPPVALPANDLIYDPFNQLIYASVPSSAGGRGNTITEIDPATEAIGQSYFVGSEPGKLALSDDGQYLYVGLQGAPDVVRFNIPADQVDLTFNLGSDSFFGPRYAEDLAVVPGEPNTVAVSRQYRGVSPRHAGVAVYVDGVQLPQTTPVHTGSNSIAYSADPGRLYGYNNETTDFGFRRMNVDLNTGVTIQDATAGLINGFNVTIKYDAGRVYSTNGRAIDPEPASGLPQLVGTYSGVSQASAVAPDSAAGRVYFLSGTQLLVFNQDTFTPIETFTLPAGGGSLIRWGDQGLAYRSTNQVYLITLTPQPRSLTTNDLIYNPANQLIYASVPSSAGDLGNTITEIDPVTDRVGRSFFVGSEPGKLALSDDGQYLYVGLQGAPDVVRFNIPADQVDLTFPLGYDSFFGPMYAEDLAVVPGEPNAVAVSREYHNVSPRHAGVAVYVDGAQLPQATPGFIGSNSIAYSSDPGRLYGYDNETTDFGFRRMNVDLNSGVTIQDNTAGLINAFNATIKDDAGRVYSTNGAAIDPEPASGLPQLVGTYSGVGQASAVAPDSAADRVYFLSGTQLLVFNQDTFTPIETFTLPASGGSLIRWGDQGLAYRSTNQVYLITLIPMDGNPAGSNPGPVHIANDPIALTAGGLPIRQLPLGTGAVGLDNPAADSPVPAPNETGVRDHNNQGADDQVRASASWQGGRFG
jgi:DNA-binding beta-propeller fold protein YncE